MFMVNSFGSVEFALAFACRFGVTLGYSVGCFMTRIPNTPSAQVPG